MKRALIAALLATATVAAHAQQVQPIPRNVCAPLAQLAKSIATSRDAGYTTTVAKTAIIMTGQEQNLDPIMVQVALNFVDGIYSGSAAFKSPTQIYRDVRDACFATSAAAQ